MVATEWIKNVGDCLTMEQNVLIKHHYNKGFSLLPTGIGKGLIYHSGTAGVASLHQIGSTVLLPTGFIDSVEKSLLLLNVTDRTFDHSVARISKHLGCQTFS